MNFHKPILHNRSEARAIVAEIIGGCSDRTFGTLLSQGYIPRPVRIGRVDFWPDAQLRRCAPRLRERERKKLHPGRRAWKPITEAARAAP